MDKTSNVLYIVSLLYFYNREAARIETLRENLKGK